MPVLSTHSIPQRQRRYGLVMIAVALSVAAAVLATPASAKRKSRHRDSVLAGMDCSACHTTEGWALSDTAGAKGGFDHDKTGFPLTGEHEKTICTGCHKPKTQVRRECFSCHTDRHRGRLGLQCDACHNAKSWSDTRAIRQHRLTRLPLTGVHAVLDCTSCHIRRNEREFLPVPADCFACHADDYRRPDVHPNHQGDPNDPSVAPFSRDCTMCHRPSSWTPAVVEPSSVQAPLLVQVQSHDRVFALSFGKHRGADCKSCHPSPRNMRLASCNGCHAHDKATLRKQHGRFLSPQNASQCLSCHPRGAAR